jgi:hypothetical protein
VRAQALGVEGKRVPERGNLGRELGVHGSMQPQQLGVWWPRWSGCAGLDWHGAFTGAGILVDEVWCGHGHGRRRCRLRRDKCVGLHGDGDLDRNLWAVVWQRRYRVWG